MGTQLSAVADNLNTKLFQKDEVFSKLLTEHIVLKKTEGEKIL
jgi:hypothetical protein